LDVDLDLEDHKQEEQQSLQTPEVEERDLITNEEIELRDYSETLTKIDGNYFFLRLFGTYVTNYLSTERERPDNLDMPLRVHFNMGESSGDRGSSSPSVYSTREVSIGNTEQPRSSSTTDILSCTGHQKPKISGSVAGDPGPSDATLPRMSGRKRRIPELHHKRNAHKRKM